MRKSVIVTFILLLNCSLILSLKRNQLYLESQTFNLRQEQYWFPQIIDHLNYQNDNTWLQRFFVFDNFFDPRTGPIIVYICGQGECRGISDTSFTAQIAQETKGLVLALQHRYYGKSMPFGEQSLSLANLRYLTSEQALSDLAYFITKMSKSGQHKITLKNPWLTIGGSYPGALSAWFRNKYPHLTIGAIASSGVVLAVQDFRMYDQQVYISLMKSGQYCVDAVLNVNNYVEDQVTSDNKQKFKAQFHATELTAREFMFYWADVAAAQVQYGNRTNFCNSLKGKTLQEQFNVMKSLTAKLSPVEYAAIFLKNQTLWIQNRSGGRSWMYQSCTQFSFFQTYAKDHPMRSRMLSIDFYRKWCDDIFGQDIWPYISRVNNQFGGLNLNTNNLIMTNGDEDPWQWASLQKSKKPQIYAHIITCDNCAHCSDLHPPNKHDARDLTATRTYQLDSIKKWIAEHYKTIKSQIPERPSFRLAEF